MRVKANALKTRVSDSRWQEFIACHFVQIFAAFVIVGQLFNQRVAGPITVLFAVVALVVGRLIGQSQIKNGHTRNGYWSQINHWWFWSGLALFAWSAISLTWGVAGYDVVSRPVKQALYLFSAINLLYFVSIHKQKFNPWVSAVTLVFFTFLCYQHFFNVFPLYSVKYPETYFNRIFVINVLLTFIVAGGFLIQYDDKKVALSVVILLAITTGLFVFGSSSETSKLIWIIGWPLLLIGYFLNSKLQNVILGILSITPLFTPFVLKYGNTMFVNLSNSNMDWITQSSGATRLGIWQETIKLIELRPIIGYGNDAMVFLTNNELLKNSLFKGGELKVGHPHNAFLQIWLEYGFVGATLSSVFLVMVSLRIAKLPDRVRSIAITLFATIILVSMVSHGAWQSWWLGSMILVSTIVSSFARSTAS